LHDFCQKNCANLFAHFKDADSQMQGSRPIFISERKTGLLIFARWRQLRLMKTDDEMRLLYLLISQQLTSLVPMNDTRRTRPHPAETVGPVCRGDRGCKCGVCCDVVAGQRWRWRETTSTPPLSLSSTSPASSRGSATTRRPLLLRSQ